MISVDGEEMNFKSVRFSFWQIFLLMSVFEFLHSDVTTTILNN